LFLGLSRLSAVAAICGGIILAQVPASAPAGKPASAQTKAKSKSTEASKPAPAQAKVQSEVAPAGQPAPDQANALSQMEASIEIQKQSLRKQSGSAPTNTFFTVAWTSAPTVALPPAADCPALPETESEPIIAAAATLHNLDPALIRAVIRQESGFHPCAVSPKGAMGLMQLMPDTAEHFKLSDPFNATENIRAGAEFLKELMGRFKGDLKRTLAAYNAGPGRVEGNPSPVPDIPETQDYVSQILKAIAVDPSKAQQKTR
jgi:soluble lytic murein transglycosylase-like protein